jgi:hypothetical protein
MREPLFQPLNSWPASWPGGSSRIVEARPLGVRFETAPWYTGIPSDDLRAYRDSGQLKVIALGAGVELVLIRDLDNLLSQLARGEEPHPEPHPRPPRSRRKRSKIERSAEAAPLGAAD